MLIWTNYVVAERGSVTDAECDKYCHCRNCQTNITHARTHTHTHTRALQHMHWRNYTRTQTNTYILTLTHKCKCARACNMHSHTTAVLVTACPPTNTQGLTMK